ncbi:MAG: FmdB family transcriptional regulator [Spirochaetales bacterium]|nr:zinc ribbon domain-containing protein [Leptospiraceae bacterium]MCP5483336.1 FmdB family transcriptional regulator [Spirochaetales bacterium]MCP5484125.1 FmdB family transcriptional regulator [Spirochaetales bacterium]
MPTYSYRCVACQHRFDAFQSMKADPLDTCPECGGRVERLIGGGAGIVFKGGGFYVTDYRKGGGGEAAGSGSGTDTGKSEGSAPTSTTKTESGAGGKPDSGSTSSSSPSAAAS